MSKAYRRREKKVNWQGEAIDPIVQVILENRGITKMGEICDDLPGIVSPQEFSFLQSGAEAIADAIASGQRITVAGDYDADGATSCALMMRFFQQVGANCDYVVPNRMVHGYGLSPALIDTMQDPKLIITVDNGISAIEACQYAKQKGIDVIITDHHLPGPVLPDALAIINPSHPDETFPDHSISGVGVAWYVMVAVRAVLDQRGYFQAGKKPNMANLLDLVALGTVADCVPLTRLNRTFVVEGLRRINQKPRPGIASLIQAAKRSFGYITTTDISFALAPRLNAAGRLQDMRTGIRLLLSEDPAECDRLAAELASLNKERQQIERDALANCDQQVNQADGAAVVYDANWHEGVIGLIASRVKEQFQVPVVAMTNDERGAIKGSARSISGIHVRDVLVEVDRILPGVIKKFGGHAMAAGMSIEASELTAFRECFCQVAGQKVRDGALEGDLFYDLELPEAYLTLDFARKLTALSPWGMGMSQPIFKADLRLLQAKYYESGFARIMFEAHGERCVALGRFTADSGLIEGECYTVFFSLSVNYFAGQESLQLSVDELQPVCVEELLDA